MANIKKYTKKDGSTVYMAKIYLGIDPLTGKPKRTTLRDSTSSGLKLKIARMQLDVKENGFKHARIYTYNDVYLLWLDVYKNTVEESTLVKTIGMFNNHIIPHFGNYRIDKIDVAYCQKAINLWFTKLEKFKVPMTYASKVFDHAVRLGILNDNPSKKITLPVKKTDTTKESEVNFYSKEELELFFNCLEKENDYQIYTLFRLLAFSGTRKGELLALTWNDIDFKNKTIKINKAVSRGLNSRLLIKAPKTKSSVRDISIDTITMKILKQWRLIQKENYLKLGFNTLKSKQLVFSNNNNEFFQPTKTREWLEKIINKNDLKRITTHGFRHTHCSLLFEAGATIKEVQDRLGHSDIQTTMNIYTHVTDKAKEQTADKFAKYVSF